LSEIVIYIFAIYVDLERSSYEILKILEQFLISTEEDPSSLSSYFDLHLSIFEMVINSNSVIKEIFEDSFIAFTTHAEDFEN